MIVLIVQGIYFLKLIKLEETGVAFDVTTEHINNLSFILNC